MTPRLFAITAAAVVAVVGSAGAAGYSGTKATTEGEKAAGAAEKLTTKDINAAIPLDTITNPTSTLAAATVDNRAGQTIGRVKSVVTGASGAATAVQVDTGGNHVVSLDAKNLTYIPDRHILLTRLTKAEVERLPAAKS